MAPAAQVAPAQVEDDAEARGQAGADLGVAGLQPHRGAAAVGDHRLQANQHAVAKRHAPAAERIGLHRVDRGARAAPAPPDLGGAEQQAAADGGQQGGGQVDPRRGAQSLIQGDVEQGDVGGLGEVAHQHHEHPGQCPHHAAEQHQQRLAGADQGAELGQQAAGAERRAERQAAAGRALDALRLDAHGAASAVPSSSARIGAQPRRWMAQGPRVRRAWLWIGAL
jgi:hypothetical protein